MASGTAARTWVARHRSALLTLFLTALGLALAGFRLGPFDTTSWLAGAAFVLGLGVIHAVRERVPLAVLGLGLAVVALEIAVLRSLSLGSLIILGDLVYVVGLREDGRWLDIAAIVVGIGSAVGLAALVAADGGDGLLGLIVTLGVVASGSMWWGREVRRPRLAAESERARADAILEAARAREAAAVAEERLRVARDLHDAVAGSVSAIALQSTAALAASGATPDELRRSLDGTRTISLEALRELQDMIGVLSAPAPTATPAPSEAIERVLRTARAGGLEVELAEGPVSVAALSPAVLAAVVRVLQESLTNVVRHAPGRRALVALAVRDGRVQLVVRNESPATSEGTTIGSGSGVEGMRDRVRELGGDLSARWRDGEWRVAASIPTAGRRAEVLP